VKKGAFDYLVKPVRIENLVQSLHDGMVNPDPATLKNGLRSYMEFVFNNSPLCATDVTTCDLYSQVYLQVEAYFQQLISIQLMLAQAMEKFEYDRQRGKFRNWLLTVTRSKLSNFFTRRQRLPEPTSQTALGALLELEPSAAEQSSWDAEYYGRLFQWAAEQLRPTIQESTWQAFWRTTIDEEDAGAALGEGSGEVDADGGFAFVREGAGDEQQFGARAFDGEEQ
jgi:hypothetical protein